MKNNKTLQLVLFQDAPRLKRRSHSMQCVNTSVYPVVEQATYEISSNFSQNCPSRVLQESRKGDFDYSSSKTIISDSQGQSIRK